MLAPYSIEATAAAQADLAALQPTARQRIARRIDTLAENPRPPGVVAVQGRPGHLRIRVGDYRVVYHVDDGRRLVTVIIVGNRRDIYKRLQRRL